MIELHTAPTPNGWKISIMLEECGLAYEAHEVSLGKGEQHLPAFLAMSPNGRIPAIFDRDPAGGGAPVPVFETAAILIYLAEKSSRFLPTDLRGRTEAIQWLVWQVAGLGPMLGQHGHFKLYAPEKLPYAIDRYRTETLRLYGVMDRRLEGRDYLAADQYTIADMACFPWVQTWKAQEIPLDQFANVQAWYNRLKERPALRRGMDLMRGAARGVPSGGYT
ncbi:MAG: thiol:disulfide oxidoreductase, partial [Burkholderiales bacterium]